MKKYLNADDRGFSSRITADYPRKSVFKTIRVNPRLIKISQSSQEGITLLELIIAITLLFLVLATAMSVDMAGQWFFKTTTLQAEIQDELQPAMEHMVKNIQAAHDIRLDLIGTDAAVMIHVDLAADGQSPGDGRIGTGGDCWRVYRYRLTGSTNEIWYYPDYRNPGSSYEVIATGITDNPIFSLSANGIFLTITLTGQRVIKKTPTESVTESTTLISGVTLRCRAAII